MIRATVLVTAALAALGSGAAVAGERCDAPVVDWQPTVALQQKLETDGWKVRRIKTEHGCYEAHGVDTAGKSVEATYNPKTLQLVKIEGHD